MNRATPAATRGVAVTISAMLFIYKPVAAGTAPPTPIASMAFCERAGEYFSGRISSGHDALA
ncbi:hypothetical protein GCM10018771_12320 [Streptomyces cellulosae]|nr:hypothetical protein GCM10018771_12320 [Streptomyces cellulosae]